MAVFLRFHIGLRTRQVTIITYNATENARSKLDFTSFFYDNLTCYSTATGLRLSPRSVYFYSKY